MLFKALSAAVFGIDAYPVEVEVDISAGLPNFTTVGLPDAAVRESRERIKSAIKNCGLKMISLCQLLRKLIVLEVNGRPERFQRSCERPMAGSRGRLLCRFRRLAQSEALRLSEVGIRRSADLRSAPCAAGKEASGTLH